MELQDIPNEYLSNPQLQQLGRRGKDFMEWFLKIEDQIYELAHQWAGEELDLNSKTWIKTKNSIQNQMMNEQGVKWAVQFLKSFLGRATQSTSYNDEYVNFIMREYVSNNVFNSLESHYFDYGFKRGVDMETIGIQLCNLCLAMLNGARANGFRDFISKTHTVQEVKHEDISQRSGMFSNLFGGKRNNQNYQQ